MTTSAYRLDPVLDRPPAGGRLGSGDRFLAGLAALLLALSFAFPLWGVRFSTPERPVAVELRVYATHLTGGGSPYVDELAEVVALHRQVGLAPPPVGTRPWNLALTGGLGVAALFAAVAAWSARRRWLDSALQLAAAAAALALAMAYGHLAAMPVPARLVGAGHAGGLVAEAGLRTGAGLVALAMGLAAAALWLSRPRLRKKP